MFIGNIYTYIYHQHHHHFSSTIRLLVINMAIIQRNPALDAVFYLCIGLFIYYSFHKRVLGLLFSISRLLFLLLCFWASRNVSFDVRSCCIFIYQLCLWPPAVLSVTPPHSWFFLTSVDSIRFQELVVALICPFSKSSGFRNRIRRFSRQTSLRAIFRCVLGNVSRRFLFLL